MSTYWFLLIIFLNFSIFSLILCQPPKLNEFKTSRSLKNGTKFTLFCAIYEGTKPLQFEWRFNDQLLSSSSLSNQKYQIEMIGDERSLLAIDDIHPNHSGTYSCIARNDFGHDKQSTRLIVTGLHFPSICGALYSLVFPKEFFKIPNYRHCIFICQLYLIFDSKRKHVLDFIFVYFH